MNELLLHLEWISSSCSLDENLFFWNGITQAASQQKAPAGAGSHNLRGTGGVEKDFYVAKAPDQTLGEHFELQFPYHASS